MSSYSRPHPRVLDWRYFVEAELDRAGLRHPHGIGYDLTPHILAHIHVESHGDPRAHRPDSQYWGLLQIGTAMARDLGHRDARVYDDDGEASIRAYISQAQRYADAHNWEPPLMAIWWKGGIGTLRKYIQLFEQGTSQQQLNQFLEERWNTDVYLYRHTAAYRTYCRHLREESTV